MATPNDINPNELIGELSKHLKTVAEIKPPVWAKFVKTGHHKERPPVNTDWWHIRAASVLRTVYMTGPIGTSKLRTKYGGKKNRGVASEHSYKGSGSIIRKVLQQLEKAGLILQAAKGMHKGRVISPKGRSLLNKIAKGINPAIIKPKTEQKKTENKSAAEPKPEPAKKAKTPKKQAAKPKEETA